MVSEGIALRLMHLYRLLGASRDVQARAAIQHEIDKLSVELDRAFAAADLDLRDSPGPAESQPRRRS